jgi:glycosyltransferase involved in cell wall biosynthesis
LSARKTLHFVLPGNPETLTGGYIYDRSILRGLTALGWDVRLHVLDSSFPFPTDDAVRLAAECLVEIETRGLVVIDGLALGAMPEVVARHSERLRLVGLVHHPLSDETGLDASQRRKLADSEKRALRSVRRIIVTSPWTMQTLTGRGISNTRIGVVIPGTAPASIARGSGSSATKLLCVATLTPRKGHAVLFDALSRLRDRPWKLDCVGSLARDAATAEALQGQIERTGLADRVRLLGEVTVEALDACYASADIFVLASYLEGYGMAHAEALARGLPIVATAAGAVPHTIPSTAALLVEPGDTNALARALARVLDDAELRETLARGARAARERLPTWVETCSRFDTELRAIR